MTMGEDARDDPFRNPAHGPATPSSPRGGSFEGERTAYRVTYEEQCAQSRQHYQFKTRARNRPLETVLERMPVRETCPRCGGPVIGLPNRQVIE